MQAQTFADELAGGAIAAAGQLLGNVFVEMLTQGDARILHGQEALDLKLVDQIGYFEDAIAYAVSKCALKDYNVITYEMPFTIANIFGSAETDSKSIQVNLPGQAGTNWTSFVEPGKMYFLPACW